MPSSEGIDRDLDFEAVTGNGVRFLERIAPQ